MTASADRAATPGLMLTALGIVYGDLGTSPLYTMQTIVGVAGKVDAAAAIGLLSLIIWALLLTVSVKYCLFVMRADNHGEGGILALMSLVTSGTTPSRRRWLLVAMGLFGAALLYGDGAITPAISVLSALEGINVVTTAFKPYVMPVAVVVLLALFAAQTLGTARIGKVFGPVMLLWFAGIAAIGVVSVVEHPRVLLAVDPRHAIGFLDAHGLGSLAVLGGVFLALTGAEALYADMGHIGRNPIRAAWYGLVLPALLLSYAGQTALIMEGGLANGANPFWLAIPPWAVLPMVVLATAATIIASQAIITGAFSLTRQAIQLGWLPGLQIRQTSNEEYGQIYVPFVNWALMAVTLALTIGFGSSDRLAGAYGTAVATTMLLTTALLYCAMTAQWGWSPALAGLMTAVFLTVDLAFFAANLLKIADGGWIPLLLGAILFTLMTSWRAGVEALRQRLVDEQAEPARFIQMLLDGRHSAGSRDGGVLHPRQPPGAGDHGAPRPRLRLAAAAGVVADRAFRGGAAGGRRAPGRGGACRRRVLAPDGAFRLRRGAGSGCGAGGGAGARLRDGSGPRGVFRRARPGLCGGAGRAVAAGMAADAVRVHVPQRRAHRGPVSPAGRAIHRDRSAGDVVAGLNPPPPKFP